VAREAEVLKEPKAEEDDLPNIPARDEGPLQLVDDGVEGDHQPVSDDPGNQLDVAREEGKGPVRGDAVSGLAGLVDEGEEATEERSKGRRKRGWGEGRGMGMERVERTGGRRGLSVGLVEDCEEEGANLRPEGPVELVGEAIEARRPPGR
jgi:hypothetical protein